MERYILARLLVGGFVLFLIIFLIIRIAGGGDVNDETTDQPDFVNTGNQVVLTDLSTSDSSSVVFLKDGEINAQEDHRQIRFTISQSRRVVEILQGYNGKVVDKISLPNTESAYEQFLYALDNEGYTSAKKEPTQTDSRGICNDKTRYFYQVRSGASTLNELWSTSCRDSHGTFAGDRSDIVRLFEKQFPTYQAFEREAKIGSKL